MPLVTPWMDLEGIMLNEINKTEKGKYCMTSLIYGSENKQNTNSLIQRTDWWLLEVRGQRVGEIDKGGQMVQTSSYKINKLWGINVQHWDCS